MKSIHGILNMKTVVHKLLLLAMTNILLIKYVGTLYWLNPIPTNKGSWIQ